jgi:hypothetical protein
VFDALAPGVRGLPMSSVVTDTKINARAICNE